MLNAKNRGGCDHAQDTKDGAHVRTSSCLVAQFAIDDSVPLHQVTYALEQARMSFELMIQVRNRALEATQQLMNMQI